MFRDELLDCKSKPALLLPQCFSTITEIALGRPLYFPIPGTIIIITWCCVFPYYTAMHEITERAKKKIINLGIELITS